MEWGPLPGGSQVAVTFGFHLAKSVSDLSEVSKDSTLMIWYHPEAPATNTIKLGVKVSAYIFVEHLGLRTSKKPLRPGIFTLEYERELPTYLVKTQTSGTHLQCLN